MTTIIAETATKAEFIVADAQSATAGLQDFKGADVRTALDGMIMRAATHNIVAINMSFATDSIATDCDFLLPSVPEFGILDDMGISMIAAAGNVAWHLGTLSPPGIGFPACLSPVVSVSGTYDFNKATFQAYHVDAITLAPLEDHYCWDGPIPPGASATQSPEYPLPMTDEVPCLMQSAPILDLYAPGVFISFPPSFGISTISQGSSAAAAFVTGAYAVMRGQGIELNADYILPVLKAIGPTIIDERFDSEFPFRKTRLDLQPLIPLGPPDADGDTVPDPSDNCETIPNVNQIDADKDGYGCLCDQDTNQDNVVGGPDFSPILVNFGAAATGAAASADTSCDGIVGGPDFAPILANFGSAVGPSGLSCAGEAPCPCS